MRLFRRHYDLAGEAVLVSALATVLMLGLSQPSLAMGKGGGKPPKDDPPMGEPVFVYDIVDAVDQFGLADIDGNNVVVYQSDTNPAADPTWLPNGQDIVFEGDIAGVRGLYRLRVVDDSGDPVINGTPELVLNTFGAITPDLAEAADGTLLMTFADNAIPDSAAEADVFLARLEADGTPLLDAADNPIILNVTSSDPVSDYGQALSPSGDKLAYISGDSHLAIKIVNVFINGDGSLATDSPGILVESGDLTPLGALTPSRINGTDYSINEELVVFATVPGSDRDLWIIPVLAPELAAPLAVTPETAEIYPSWSPDGLQIVYRRQGKDVCSNKKGGTGIRGLAIRYADGGLIGDCAERQILSSKQNGPRIPDWRPN